MRQTKSNTIAECAIAEDVCKQQTCGDDTERCSSSLTRIGCVDDDDDEGGGGCDAAD